MVRTDPSRHPQVGPPPARPEGATERLPTHSIAVLCFLCVLVPLAVATALCGFRGAGQDRSWPYNSFLPQLPLFGDYLAVHVDWANHHFYGAGHFPYFPAVYIPYEGLTLLTSNPHVAAWGSVVVVIVGFSVMIMALLWRRGRAVVALGVGIFLLSYPMMVTFVTGNTEGWIGVLLLVTFAFNAKGRWKWAAVILGLAVAMKGIPIVFLPVLLVGRTRREGVVACTTCVGTVLLTTLAAVVALPGGLPSGFGSIHRIYQRNYDGLAAYRRLMVDTPAGTHFGHSFLNGIHAFFGENVLPSEQYSTIVGAIGLVLLAAIFTVVVKQHGPTWMLLALSASAGCLLVPTSTDYKLLYFIPAIIILLREQRLERRIVPGVMLLCFIITPKPWGQRLADPFTTASAYLTPLLMLVLSGWIFAYAISMSPPTPEAGSVSVSS